MDAADNTLPCFCLIEVNMILLHCRMRSPRSFFESFIELRIRQRSGYVLGYVQLAQSERSEVGCLSGLTRKSNNVAFASNSCRGIQAAMVHHDTSYSEERKRLNGNESVISLLFFNIYIYICLIDLYCLIFSFLIGVDC